MHVPAPLSFAVQGSQTSIRESKRFVVPTNLIVVKVHAQAHLLLVSLSSKGTRPDICAVNKG